ncbi:MAG TPA: EAL domain-containing protein [Bacilli bacterium]|nr:EAL domain-containing protein [Bacilli bacterium]
MTLSITFYATLVNTEELLQLNWLNQTPIRKGLLGLKDNGTFKTNMFETFDVVQEKQTKQTFYGNIHSQAFPPKELLFNHSFMGDENTILVIPIVQEDHYFGMFGFVGTDDIMTQLMPLHTTYQLATYFAAGYLRANITERMNNYSQQLEMISDIIYDGIWEYTNTNKEIVCRGGIVQHFGERTNYANIDFERIVNIIHPKDREFFIASLALDRRITKQINLEVRVITNNNQLMWIQIVGQFIYVDGKLTKAVGSVKDITNRKKADAKINELAFYDTLTGLANRISFEEQLAKEIEIAKDNDQSIALILCDLDRFKVINDSYGHKVGDHILKTVAARVKPLLAENQFFARFGSDEFVVIMPHINDNQEAYQLASDIVQVINQPIYDEHRHYQISTSVGISIYPENSKATDILVSADIAMHSAKAEGRNRIHIFNDQIKHHNASQIKLEEQLRHAVEYDELSLHFQPIYYVDSEEIYGVEALLRWNSKEFGKVSPRDFIPLAEETGLIVSIGEWVIYEAIRVMKKWQRKYDVPIKMFINLSSRQVNHPNFSRELKRIFDITDIDPRRISFEITESMMIDNFEQGKLILAELIDMGVKLSLDDFGTGYSSLSSLRHLPFQILKIDKSFIDDLSAVDANVAILKAIIEMAHSLNLSVVAEGIERQEQYDLVASLGVDFIQGYYTNPPLPEDKIEKFFKRKHPQKPSSP